MGNNGLQGEPADFNAFLTDELWEDLVTLEGTPVETITIWETSIVDEDLEEEAGAAVTEENRVFVDLDLYLANRTLLELYGAALLPDEQSDPIVGMEAISETLSDLVENGMYIQEVSSDEEDRLVLVLADEHDHTCLLFVTGWSESTWENLPDEEADA
jgi:hypothetical protein